MKYILACVDFSAITNRVTEIAAELARQGNARLLLAHVLVVPPAPMAYGGTPEMLAGNDPIPEMKQAARENLERERCRLQAAYGIEAVPMLLEGMNPAAAIFEEAVRIQPEIIVVGSHGRGLIGRMLLGSTSQYLVLHANWPVLVVPAAKPAAIRVGSLAERTDAPVVPAGARVAPA